jgi:hypothetical protein
VRLIQVSFLTQNFSGILGHIRWLLMVDRPIYPANRFLEFLLDITIVVQTGLNVCRVRGLKDM